MASNVVSVTTNSAGDTQAPTVPANLTASSITQNSVQLTWSASSDNVGVTGYDVYSGANIIGSTTTTGFSATGLTPATTYSFTVKAKDAAGNISAASNTVSVTTSNTSATYCTVTNGSPGQYITKVVFGSISNTSALTTGGYANYTNLTASAAKGSNVSLQVTLHYLWSGSRAGAWIDWNRDGDFTDAGEQILNAAGTSVSVYTVNVTIPPTALTGTTRMRIRAEYGLSTISPCGNGWHSEVEDYSVTVTGSASGPEVLPGSDIFGTSSVQVYPNPSRGTFTVQVPQDSHKTLIHVYNILGALIKTIESDNTAFIEVSLQTTPGLYTVRIHNNAKRSTHSIQIE